VARRSVRLVAVCVVAVLVPVLASASSPAQPIDDLREQAAQLTTQIEENGAKVAALGEQLNAAQIKLDEARAKIDAAQQEIDAAAARIDELRLLIAERSAAIYRTAGTNGPLDSIEVDNANEAGAKAKYTDVATAKDDALVDELNAAKQDLERERAGAEDARQAAEQERDELAAAKAAADAAAADQEALLAQVEGEISALVAEEQERRAAAAAAATPEPAEEPSEPSAPPSSEPSAPPPSASGGAGAAVAYAQAQLGKPYCYGGTGPACFDCSGLTMMAWQQGGVDMPHYSGAQGSMFPSVPLAQLQPGDLITTSSWDAHVGIWVGGGYVHATHTGDVIRFVGGSGSVQAAVRPG